MAVERKVSRITWSTQPDPKKVQADLDEMTKLGWTLELVSNVTGSGGGSVLHYWRRELPDS